MTTYYVSNTGKDTNSGKSATYALKTLAKVNTLIQNGDIILLKRANLWNETIWITKDNITIKPYGSGANPRVGGMGAAAAIGIKGKVRIEDIDTYGSNPGVYITGPKAIGTVIRGVHEKGGSGIVAGGGGILELAENCITRDNTITLGAGDGIQISQDAGYGPHKIVGCESYGNSRTGLNVKVGRAYADRCYLHHNGECGWVAQNDQEMFIISNSIIKENNQRDNGVGQASVEDYVKVWSINNRYENIRNGNLYTTQVNIIANRDGWEFHSLNDEYIATVNQTQLMSSIQINTTAIGKVRIDYSKFTHTQTGLCIDGYGSKNVNIEVRKTEFNTKNTTCIRYCPPSWLGITDNLFNRADNGVVIEAQDIKYLTAADLKTPSAPTPAPTPTPTTETGVIQFAPQAAWQNRDGLSEGGTFSCLFTTKQLFGPVETVEFSMRTISQTRINNPPNGWEVGWFMWGFSREGEIVQGEVLQWNQKALYLAFKAMLNGLELGKLDGTKNPDGTPVYPGAQKFFHPIYPTPVMVMNEWSNWKIEINNTNHKIYCNGILVGDITETERPILSGKLALYCEDAQVEFKNVKTTQGPLPFGPAQRFTADGTDFGAWHTEWLGGGYCNIT